MQQIQITGNLGKDAEVKKVNGGTEKLFFSVCVTERYKKDDGSEVENSTWYNCIYKNTKIGQYLKKGNKIFVQGNLSAGAYKNDRNEAFADLLINVNLVEFLTSKKD